LIYTLLRSACTAYIVSTDFYARRSKGAEIAAAEKAARDAQAKADAIDAAVYDLKAVNPRVADADTASREILPDGAPDRGQNLADQHEMFVAPENTNARFLLLCQEPEDPKRSEVRY
jgi:hypothetical protein